MTLARACEVTARTPEQPKGNTREVTFCALLTWFKYSDRHTDNCCGLLVVVVDITKSSPPEKINHRIAKLEKKPAKLKTTHKAKKNTQLTKSTKLTKIYSH